MNRQSTWISLEEAKQALASGTGRGIRVAVIDSGIELDHPALNHLRLGDDLAFGLNSQNVVQRAPGWGRDLYGHGTAVACTILRAAPEAQLGSFRVLDSKLSSKFAIIEEAVMTAIDRGYSIVNCSFGSRAKLDTIGHFKLWIDHAYRQGVHVVSACNNSHFRDPEWPGHFTSVITVNMAATTSDDLFFRWDPSSAPSRHLVEFAARGVDLELPWKNKRLMKQTGSSFAAPHVSGLLARLLSVYPALKPPVAKALLQEIALPWTRDLAAPNG